MSDQSQLNKKEQPLENTAQTADNENVPSVSNNAEFKEDDFSEEELERQKILSRANQEESRGDQLRADLKELDLEPLQQARQEPARQESPVPAHQESPVPARQESPVPARQKMPESRGHDSGADQKEELMVDAVAARQEGPEAARQERPEAARKEDPEPTQTEIQKPEPTVVNLGRLGAAAVVVLIAVWLGLYFPQFHGTQTSDTRSALQIFQDQFKSLQKDFPKQSRDLWLRSEKMLRNHLNKSEPHEPATIILTAAQDAKHTLLCLGSGLAQTYAAAHNARWLVIHGPSESEYDDSTAKLHIDEKLSSGFQTKYRAAVLNRLETLPPGSLLILYKYCDHENAAYKNVALVFTVLLEESSLEPGISLPELEEKVRDFLWQQFISSSTIRSHMEMDSDKMGGVWSRISHLVLPVVPVESIEVGNCPFDEEGN